MQYCIAGMFGKLPNLKFGKWIDFNHRDAIYKLKFGSLKFGEPWTVRQTFPLPNVPAVRYLKCFPLFING